MSRIAVIDYGASNLRSVVKALQHVAGADHQIAISNTPSTIAAADKIVFPGQGAMRQCMTRLNQSKLAEAICAGIRNKPFLGICLGLQTLFTDSDEDGGTAGLNAIHGHVVRFTRSAEEHRQLKIPHMGWNQVQQSKPHPLWQGITDQTRFYFVHSYFVIPDDSAIIAAQTDYLGAFTAAIAQDNLFATQFHPEKSQQPGLQLLRNFIHWQI